MKSTEKAQYRENLLHSKDQKKTAASVESTAFWVSIAVEGGGEREKDCESQIPNFSTSWLR